MVASGLLGKKGGLKKMGRKNRGFLITSVPRTGGRKRERGWVHEYDTEH